MELTLSEKLELQKFVRQGLEKLRSGQIVKLSERLALQKEIRLALDKLKGRTSTAAEESAPTGMTEEYRKLLAGAYNNLAPHDYGIKSNTICRDEATAIAAATGEPLSRVELTSKAAALMKEPARQYLDAHYNAEKDLFEYKAV